MTGLVRMRRSLGPGRIGILYVWAIMIVAFSVWKPDVFPTVNTIRDVLNLNALSGIAALAVLVPMASGAIDASIGGNISLTSVCCAWLFLNTSLPMWGVVALTLGLGAAIGLVNVFVVVVLRIPSIIGTLAVWLICDALSSAVAGNQSSLAPPQLSGQFGNYFAINSWQNFTIPVLFVLVLGVIMGTVLTQTAQGRYTYAVGLNPEVARNTGIRVKLIQSCALVIGGVLGAFAGMVLTAQYASAAPLSGDAYLLPAFAAVFLGATQFRLKRFTAWGTILAVFMLATGKYGLALAGAAPWVPNVFEGLALIVAIGLSKQVFSRTAGAPRRSRRTQGSPGSDRGTGVGVPTGAALR
jgi:ribose transport system permease protein